MSGTPSCNNLKQTELFSNLNHETTQTQKYKEELARKGILGYEFF